MSDLNELFYRDTYAREFTADVVSCTEGKNGFEVVLSDTAFYPEGGGQPADHGKLGDAVVTDVKRVSGIIVHCTDKALTVGSTVKGVLDWSRRYDNMQNHTGEHVISGLIHKKYGFDNVGFHMDEDVITVDFDGVIPTDELLAIEQQVNDAIYADIPVNVLFPSAEELKTMDYRSKKELTGKVRIVDIPGCDRCACCGTHVAKTGEIGLLKVLSSEKHRGGTRILFVCGARALRDYAAKNASVRRISELLSAKPAEVAEAVEKLLTAQNLKESEVIDLKKKLLTLKAEALPASDTVIIRFEDGMTPQELRTFATVIADLNKTPAAAVLSTTAPDTFSYVLYGPADKMRDVSKALNQKLCGRGGGNSGFIQGSYKASRDAIAAAITEAFAAL